MVHEDSSPRVVVANVLSKLAIYFLSFGLVLLLLGGVRALLFPSNDTTKILVILGLVTALLGIIYTVVVVALVKCMTRDMPSNMLNRNIEMASSISGGFAVGGHSSNFSYANPTLRTAEEDKWEAPPCYEDAIRAPVHSQSQAGPSVEIHQASQEVLPSTTAAVNHEVTQ